MRSTFVITVLSIGLAADASAQGPSGAAVTPAALQLTVDDAVKMALDQNVDLKADRLDPQISDTRVAAAVGFFRPAFNSAVQRNNQLQPPISFLIPTPTQNDVVTSSAGLSQHLSWFGTSYSVAWNATHTASNSFLNSYNPLVQSGLTLSLSQPLLRDWSIDAPRQLVRTSRTNRAIADTRLRESVVHTIASVKTAYWNLVSAIATVVARQSTLDLAQELSRVNKAKVDVGASPPLDLVSAQAEVAANQEQLIIAQTTIKEAEDRLRLLIFDPADPATWTVKLAPTDVPPTATITPDIDAAVATALRERADLERARKDIENADTSVTFANNQRLPDVRFNASYVANGLGGTIVNRDLSTGFPGRIIGPGPVTDFGTVLSQLFSSKYPTWIAGVNVTYPLGVSVEDANFARAKLERAQTVERLKGSQARAIQQVRDAGWKIDMNAKRIETTRAARELAEQRLDVERKRFEVGMSTSFLVIQAQRDLAQATTNELSAVLAYDLSLVDFEALQQASPASQTAAAPSGPSTTTAGAFTSSGSGSR
jgi:outer membrane protein TolC